MTGRIQLFNAALLAIGHARINDPDGATEAAIVCRELYPQARDMVLMDHPWACAIRRADLGELSVDSTLSHYEHVYQLPVEHAFLNMVTLLDPNDNYREFPYEPWSREGDRLFTDLSPCAIKYVARIEVHEMDAHVAQALSYLLAAHLAIAIKDSPELEGQQIQKYESAKLWAQTIDARMAKQRLEPDTPWSSA